LKTSPEQAQAALAAKAESEAKADSVTKSGMFWKKKMEELTPDFDNMAKEHAAAEDRLARAEREKAEAEALLERDEAVKKEADGIIENNLIYLKEFEN
jgi:hypothetical protein